MSIFIDTHAHLYLEQFDNDRNEAVIRAVGQNVKYMLLPNVDEDTIEPMLSMIKDFPDSCLPMMGLHPTSVKPGFEKVLDKMYKYFTRGGFCAVGESGIDLYWDKTYFDLQVRAFQTQIEWALQFDLPIVVHARNSLNEIMEALKPFTGRGLKGVMHCFPGTVEQARWFVDFGFKLGIGGVVTYKKSDMAKVVESMPLQCLILETDAPYLPPVPYRGKRNEPSFIPIIAEKISQIKGISIDDVADQTTQNAKNLFGIE
jgi:TatD DNase family protein